MKTILTLGLLSLASFAHAFGNTVCFGVDCVGGVLTSVQVNTPLTGNGTTSSPVSAPSSSFTLQGNAFNGASQLVQMTAGNTLPAVDGSLLTNLPASSNGFVLRYSTTVAVDAVAFDFTGLNSVTQGGYMLVYYATATCAGTPFKLYVNGDVMDGDYQSNHVEVFDTSVSNVVRAYPQILTSCAAGYFYLIGDAVGFTHAFGYDVQMTGGGKALGAWDMSASTISLGTVTSFTISSFTGTADIIAGTKFDLYSFK